MNPRIIRTENGVDYNSLGERVIQCKLCNNKTTMLGIKLCYHCYNLLVAIRGNLKIVKQIIEIIERERL